MLAVRVRDKDPDDAGILQAVQDVRFVAHGVDGLLVLLSRDLRFRKTKETAQRRKSSIFI